MRGAGNTYCRCYKCGKNVWATDQGFSFSAVGHLCLWGAGNEWRIERQWLSFPPSRLTPLCTIRQGRQLKHTGGKVEVVLRMQHWGCLLLTPSLLEEHLVEDGWIKGCNKEGKDYELKIHADTCTTAPKNKEIKKSWVLRDGNKWHKYIIFSVMPLLLVTWCQLKSHDMLHHSRSYFTFGREESGVLEWKKGGGGLTKLI